jgi:hypothetical protein
VPRSATESAALFNAGSIEGRRKMIDKRMGRDGIQSHSRRNIRHQALKSDTLFA